MDEIVLNRDAVYIGGMFGITQEQYERLALAVAGNLAASLKNPHGWIPAVADTVKEHGTTAIEKAALLFMFGYSIGNMNQ